MEIKQDVIATHPFLQHMPETHLDILLKDSRSVDFRKDEIILREGEYADRFYLIHQGEISLECHTPEGNITIEILRDNDILGWSWLFPPFSWHFQARAISPTTALQLNGANLLIASEENDKFGHDLMKRIAQVAIHRLQETRKCLVDVCRKNDIELGAMV